MTSACAPPWLTLLPYPLVVLTPEGKVTSANPAAVSTLGVRLTDPGASILDIAPASEQAALADVLRHVRSGQSWAGDLRLGLDADAPRIACHLIPAQDGAEVTCVVMTYPPGGADTTWQLHASERLNRLARVVADLQTAADLRAVTDVVVSHVADAAGATTASLSLVVDEDTLELAGLRGAAEGTAERWSTFPLDTTTPAGVALLGGRPMLWTGRAAVEDQFPDIELSGSGERSLLALPLMRGQRKVGVATLSFPGLRELDTAEIDFYGAMADSCAQALERVRSQATVEEQNHKLRFLAEASAELASDLDYERTLSNVAWMAVPDLADWCAISLLQDGTLRTLAVAHRDPAKVQLAEELQRLYPPDPKDRSGTYQVIDTGESLLIPEIPDEMLVASAKDATHLEMIRALALRSALTVPLTARGEILGAITWVNGEDGRRFGPQDLAFGEDLARRAGVAIDNARLHQDLRRVAERLQEAVQPPELPVVPGWELTASYATSGRIDVGGDFYEVLPLQFARTAILVGDVMGRGVDAAVATAQIRTAARSFIVADSEPGTVLHRLERLYEQFPSDQLVSLVYAVADPEHNELALASAGHPAPLLRRADGSCRFLEAKGSLLGLGDDERRVIRVAMLPGDTVFFYTDGLLERRREDLDAGVARLQAAVEALPDDLTTADLDGLVARLRDPSRDDDVAILAARRLPR